MDQEERLKYLKIALNVIGVLFIVGFPATRKVDSPIGNPPFRSKSRSFLCK